ncbi:MAG: hypothetical protein EAZ37_05165 [Burkholderiales bacterium]|nr:MAG: hypothetical protein EAZ37_05165 [Burkholderiales bacterium]
MLKEVGTSGQISLGKKFAGQLFDVQFLDTGAVQMLPVRVVPAMASASHAQQANPAPSSGIVFHQQFSAWVNEMNQMVEQHGVWSDGLMEAEQPHGAV